MSNLISIITPLYNAEKYISSSIDSVLSQTYNNWELIIVDDLSTDGSYEIVRAYANKDNRIRVIQLNRNSGAAEARNRALAESRGKYVAFLDSDDIWCPEKLEQQIEFMERNSIDFSFTEYLMINEQETVISRKVSSPDKISYRGLLCGAPIMCSTVMLNMENIKDIRMPDIRSGQDYATWANLLESKTKYAYNVGAVLAKYRKQSGSLSANKINAFKRTWNINRQHLNLNVFTCIFCISIYAARWIIKHYFSFQINRPSAGRKIL